LRPASSEVADLEHTMAGTSENNVRARSRSPRRGVDTMLVNGKPEPALVSVHDLTFIRGDGAFEVVSLIPSPSDPSVGVPTGVKLHLDRLKSTCGSLRLPLEHDFSAITEWLTSLGKEHGPGYARIIITRGNPDKKEAASRCIMLHNAPPNWPAEMRLVSMSAPWHIGYAMAYSESPPAYSDNIGVDAWHTIKWMSYAPNVLVTRLATEKGANDALLIAADGRVLDGPTFAIGFIIDGKIRFIAAGANHMLPSCTQAMVVQAAKAAGLPFSEDRVTKEEMQSATAAFIMSANRHVCPVAAIDGKPFQMDDAVLLQLKKAYWSLVDDEVRAAA